MDEGVAFLIGHLYHVLGAYLTDGCLQSVSFQLIDQPEQLRLHLRVHLIGLQLAFAGNVAFELIQLLLKLLLQSCSLLFSI
mmetsp:Transcript_115/g.130  ORF Transcript_115/g.130 Transcript_115/m.130 type:complete len:81 (+) Transcript_115:331-573(+)